MLPLTRQDTRPSIYSWWSDSNPGLRGPTINIHAVAKPLMRRMYHRQASQLIRKNRGEPLSTTMLETYLSYLPWDFVSWSTKAAIFDELAERAESKVDEARAVVDSPDFSHIMQMVKSPDMGARISSCRLMGSLAIHECTIDVMLELRTCGQLMSMLRDKDSRVVDGAAHALSQIARSSDGAQAVVDARVLDLVLELLESPSPRIRKWTCVLLGNLATHESTTAAVLVLKPYKSLVSLLSNRDSGDIESAVHTLSQIARPVDGAQGIVDAGSLDLVSELLESPSSNIRKWACLLVAYLASHDPIASSVRELKPYKSLVFFLSDNDSNFVEGAMSALTRIVYRPDGAQAIVDAGALDHVSTLLKSHSPIVRKLACVLVGNLASLESTTVVIFALRSYKSLVSLLSDGDSGIVDGATYALSHIARLSDGSAQAIVDAGALGLVLELLELSSPIVRKWACMLVGNLASRKSTTAAVLALRPYKSLLSLLSDEDFGVVNEAIFTLSQIACSSDGAQAIVDAGALNHIGVLLESPSSSIRAWTCELVGNLVSHKCAAAAVLALKPHKSLVSLLSDKNSGVVDGAVFALAGISGSLDGRQAIVDAQALDCISGLFESRSPSIRKWACSLVGKLTYHESTRAAVLALKPYPQIVSLMSDEDSGVVYGAVFALAGIAGSFDGAQAIVDAQALDHISGLFESPSPSIRKWACSLVGKLACHESTRAAVLALRPYKQIVTLLNDEDSAVVDGAVYTWSLIARRFNSAPAIVDAKILDHIPELLKTPSPAIREWICELEVNLTSHPPTAASVALQLVSLLGDKDSGAVEWAARVLSRIARRVHGAQAIASAGAVDHISELFESTSPSIRKWTCEFVGNIVFHESTRAAVLALQPYKSLVSSLSGEHSGVVVSAVYALTQIARPVDGAQAIVNAGVLDHISELLESLSPSIRKWTCKLLDMLTSHELTLPAILELGPFEQLVSCIGKPVTGASANFALDALSEWPDGVAALAKIKQFQEKLQVLLKAPPDDETKVPIQTTLDDLD